MRERNIPKRPTTPSEAFKKATVSTPESVTGISANDWEDTQHGERKKKNRRHVKNDAR
jgi:hypothetical protein